jgi:hypothetical protein
LNDIQFDINNPIYEVLEHCDPHFHNYWILKLATHVFMLTFLPCSLSTPPSSPIPPPLFTPHFEAIPFFRPHSIKPTYQAGCIVTSPADHWILFTWLL